MTKITAIVVLHPDCILAKSKTAFVGTVVYQNCDTTLDI